jgi:hypothetical protein
MPIHPFIDSFTRPSIHAHVHRLTDTATHPPIPSSVLASLFKYHSTRSPTVDQSIHSLIFSSPHVTFSLTCSFGNLLIHPQVHSPGHPPIHPRMRTFTAHVSPSLPDNVPSPKHFPNSASQPPILPILEKMFIHIQ